MGTDGHYRRPERPGDSCGGVTRIEGSAGRGQGSGRRDRYSLSLIEGEAKWNDIC